MMMMIAWADNSEGSSSDSRNNRNADIYSPLRKMFVAGQFFLLYPYKLDSSNRLMVSRWKRRFQILLSWIITMGYLATNIWKRGVLPHDNPYITLCRIRTCFNITFLTINLVESVNDYKSSKRIVDRIRDINVVARITPGQRRDFCKKILKWMMPTYVLTVTGLMNGYYYYAEHPVYQRFLLSAFDSFCVFRPHIGQLFFLACLKLCEYYSNYVNEEIRDSLTRHERKGHRLGSIYRRDHTVAVGGNAKRRILDEAENVRRIYTLFSQICKLKGIINDRLSTRLITIIIFMFMESVFYTFFNITFMKYFYVYKPSKLLALVPGFNVWIVYQVINLIELINLCGRLADNIRKTSLTVERFLNEKLDGDVKDELKMFSLALLHNKPEITAGEFFDVDYPLLSSMASASVMHIIILLQFEFPGYGNGINPIEDIIT